MARDQLKELKRLQKQNERFGKAASNLTLDRLILTAAAGEAPEPRASSHVHHAKERNLSSNRGEMNGACLDPEHSGQVIRNPLDDCGAKWHKLVEEALEENYENRHELD